LKIAFAGNDHDSTLQVTNEMKPVAAVAPRYIGFAILNLHCVDL
jgi:hypothetical protein